ncbi:hypothetical protein NDU88_008029 [Pleurodeles waltl]|uniref:Uncharacterized protein n=1 Tax=Pleurodeles waltl TaxID=8319 RepID=A0AAV7QQP9_PLEWA|nr:hypothetical protein NDU88_008029 [Pleurodeles waltl]
MGCKDPGLPGGSTGYFPTCRHRGQISASGPENRGRGHNRKNNGSKKTEWETRSKRKAETQSRRKAEMQSRWKAETWSRRKAETRSGKKVETQRRRTETQQQRKLESAAGNN